MTNRPGPVFALAIVLSPVLCLLPTLVAHPEAWRVWGEPGRISSLAANSLALAALACLVAGPLATLLGVALGRYRLPGDRWLSALLLLGLFVPLPVVAVAWQIVLGGWLPNLALDPGQVAWRPWRQGLLPAGVVHGIAAVPALAWLTAAWLTRSDAGLIDLARIEGGERMVWRRVLAPRLRTALGGSLIWLTAIAFTEITITDAMMVRTFAEETYTELVSNPAGVPAALAATLPVWLAGVVALLPGLRLVTDEPASESTGIERPAAPLWLSGLSWLVVAVVVPLPIAALVHRASAGGLLATLSIQLRASGWVIAESLAAAVVSGALAALLAWWLTWRLGRDRRGLTLLAIVAVTLFLLPGPLLGLGLKEWIRIACDLEERLIDVKGIAYPPIRSLLYDQPSPLPAMLTAIVRFLPIAMVAILPAVRGVPRQLIDQSRLDGLSAWPMVRRVLWPLTGSAVLRAGGIVALLALGEVSASKLVNPPARRAFILDLFNQMHYGAEAGVAALALAQIAMTAAMLIVFRFSVSLHTTKHA
jgi:iron(III) transport system permease protein